MPTLSWYWQRLRAMSASEVALHARRKWRQFGDARRVWDFSAVKLEGSGAFPKLPKPEDAPEALRDALKRDMENILAGRWKAFGHLDLQVDDPPQWHKDYLAGRDLATGASAFQLDYRELPDGADIKLIWELSRWHQLTRLAMAAHVLGEDRAAAKCVEWLEDWVKHNPPYRGWNWTSALEAGMRLVQFTWIDALLGAPGPGTARGETGEAPNWIAALQPRLAKLRLEILLPHAWHVWRHKSFGSSANNHLIGELAGLILATVRWPALAQWGASLDELQSHWEHEVLAQFAGDGGNKEQALNYHLFSWEFCWQAFKALASSGRTVPPEIDERLRRAVQFYVNVQVPNDPWDYGDSDNGFVLPLFADHTKLIAEWDEWFREPREDQALEYWMGAARRHGKLAISNSKVGEWQLSRVSGYAMRRDRDLTLRWDLSPLGLPTMAAHGHLDALHVTIWVKDVALVIDPGTGAYYEDKELRTWLAARSAHNGPTPEGEDWPVRLGPFLWAETHEAGLIDGGIATESSSHKAELVTKALSLGRIAACEVGKSSLIVEDWIECLRADRGDAAAAFAVRWQFAPDSKVEDLGQRRFGIRRHGVVMEVEVSADWTEVFCVTDREQVAKADPDAPLAGTVSPAFRKAIWAPYLKLVARPQGDKPCLFRTTFLSSQM